MHISVCNVGDNAYDSGVFMEKGSFQVPIAATGFKTLTIDTVMGACPFERTLDLSASELGSCTVHLGIDEVDGVDARFSLRPNPASDRVVLSLDDAEGTADVSILSVDGRTVIHLVVNGGVAEVNMADLVAGTYFVRVQTEGWLGVRKLVVR